MWLAILVATSTVLACQRQSSPLPGTGSAAVPAGPVAEPKSMVARIVIGDADRVLASLRELLGDRGGLLFSRDHLAPLAVELGVPASGIDLVIAKNPVVCAVRLLDGKPPTLACALRVRDREELVTVTTRGASPPFSVRHDQAADGDVLAPTHGESAAILGIFHDRLIFASDEPTLLELGPYLDRSLMVAATLEGGPKHDIEAHVRGAALGDLLSPFASESLGRIPAAARALADPESILGAIRGAGDIELDLTIDKDHAVLEMTSALEENASKWGLGQGSMVDALGAPSGAGAALTVFQDRDARVSEAAEAMGHLSSLIDKEDASSLQKLLSSIAGARGDRATLGFEIGARGPAVFGDLSVIDPDRAASALTDLGDALGKKSLKEALQAAGFRLGAKNTVLERVGAVVRVRIARVVDPKQTSQESPPPVELFLRLEGARLAIGGGYDGAAALGRVLAEGKLTDEPRVHAAVARAPKTVSLALFLDLAALLAPRAHRTSSALFTVDVDPSAKAIRSTLDVDAAALSAILGALAPE